jgi:hypothetical protein
VQPDDFAVWTEINIQPLSPIIHGHWTLVADDARQRGQARSIDLGTIGSHQGLVRRHLAGIWRRAIDLFTQRPASEVVHLAVGERALA